VRLGCRLSGVCCYWPTYLGAPTLLNNVNSNPHDLPHTVNSIKYLGSAATTSDNSHGVVLKCAGVWRNFYLIEEEKAMLTPALYFVLQAVCILLRLHERCQSLPGLPLSQHSCYMYYLLPSHGKNRFANEPQYCVYEYSVCFCGFPRWCKCSVSLFRMFHIRFIIHLLRKSICMVRYMFIWYMIWRDIWYDIYDMTWYDIW
jgi:hypothetical protein